MGMSSWVVGVRDMDGKFKEMLEMKRLCEEKGFSYPKEVEVYFGGLVRESEKCIFNEMLSIKIPYKEYMDDGIGVFEVNVKDIPKEVKTIKFINSY